MATSYHIDRNFTRRMPKVELHAHLSGSISRECLHDIWTRKKARDPTLTLDDPLVSMPVGKVDYDLQTFFPLFGKHIYKLIDDIPSIIASTTSVLESFQADGVTYLELRTTPRAIEPANATSTVTRSIGGISADEYVATVLSVLSAFNNSSTHVLKSKLILSIDRRWSLALAESAVDVAIKYRAQGVIGVDLAGDPSKGDVRTLTPAFKRAKETGLKITVHFAEEEKYATDEELRTILSWQPDRLGHVIHVPEDLRKEIVAKRIGVELCLSCNVHAKMLPSAGSYGTHHFGWWFRTEEYDRISLNTDDVGVFCSPLSEEYFLAAQHFDLGVSDMYHLSRSAVMSSFASDGEKRSLNELLTRWFTHEAEARAVQWSSDPA